MAIEYYHTNIYIRVSLLPGGVKCALLSTMKQKLS